MSLASFQETLKQLGPDDVARAKILGVSERTVRLWRAKEPRIIRIIAANPALAHALAKDAGVCCDPTDSAQTAS